MTVYIVTYSIILFLLAALAVAFCFLYVHVKKKKLCREQKHGDEIKAFFDIMGGDGDVAYVIIERDSRVPVYVSEGVKRFFGRSAQEFYTNSALYQSVIDKKYVREFNRKFSEWDGQDRFEFDFGYGEGKKARVQAVTGTSDGKEYIGFTIIDITEQAEEIQAMQARLLDAQEQVAAKSSFLSNMSHEIRTPMNGVMGMMSLAKMNIGNKKKALGYLDRAGDLSVFLLSMINDILDISKIESGKMQLFNTQMDMLAFAEKIRNMFNGTVTGAGKEFVVDTAELAVRYVVSDEMRLTQVVTNLVSNANKFTPAGGKITVTFKQLDIIGGRLQLLVRVSDTGKGIAPENIKKIFRPFEQEEASTAHNYGGTGLGLAICDRIVHMMDGNIVVDSTLGKGTDFSVFLSLEIAETEQDLSRPVQKVEAPSGGTDFTFDGCKILLAEDNEVNAEIALEILESEGAHVTLAHDGAEAVEIFTSSPEHAFDIIYLDIQMPRLDGRGAARAIRNSGKPDAMAVPIIALSADAFVEDVELSKAAGMDGHVSKPIDFEVLRKSSGEAIAAKRGG